MRSAKNPDKITFFILDVDGVMTDGVIGTGSGNLEYKNFDVKDGVGVYIARVNGYGFAILSGRYSEPIKIRAKELKIDTVHMDVAYKMEAYKKILKQHRLSNENVCFIGDDIIDIPVMEICGFSAAPGDAVAEAKKAADYICKKGGGKGCVREVIELVMKRQGKWKRALDRYLGREK